MPSIPRIIHQTWKDSAVPDRFAQFAVGWRRHHPQWAYRFWDDHALRALVADRHPQLLPVFDSYARPICRVDLARYVIMESFGGIYADLDFECLAPNDALLGAHSLLIGLEPPSHLDVAAVKVRRLERLLSPAWLASTPQHPFWKAVLDEVLRRASEPDPLIATGPILLSEVAAQWRGEPLALVESALLHPIDQDACLRGDGFDLQWMQAVTQRAFATHHWAGTWWRSGDDGIIELGDADAIVLDPNGTRSSLRVHLRTGPCDTGTPLVSALMVTAHRPALAMLAIECFRAQSYPHCELVIVDDDGDDTLSRHVRALGDARLRLIKLPNENRSLGALRNIAVGAALGAYVCQWDDDDLCDPARIECQLRVLQETGSDACFLSRWTIWWPAQRRFACSNLRAWEGSMLVRKDLLPAYPELRRGEDTPVTEQVLATRRCVLLDQPRLYVYVVHGANTFDAPHFEQQWRAASAKFEGIAYRRIRQELQKRVDIDAQLVALFAAAQAAASDDAPLHHDLSLIAAFDGGYGLACAARTTLNTLRVADIQCQSVRLPLSHSHESNNDVGLDDAATAPLRIFHTNPEFIEQALRGPLAKRMRTLLAAPCTIGFWAWESANSFRSEQLSGFAHFDEIWAPSIYVRDALARVSPIPVLVMPIAQQPLFAVSDRRAWSLPDDAYVFLLAFDALSNFTRKNPLAAIAAFQLAFDAGQDALLVIKTAHLSARQRARLEGAIGPDARIRIVDALLDREAYLSLVASIDVVVSLHRAEGFGMVMAEAMALGKPVIASRYSGNLDFMDDRNSLLVEVDRAVLDAQDGCYAAGTRWGEPRIADAARHMRRLYDDRASATLIGAAAAAHIAQHLSPMRVGAMMRARLEELRVLPRAPCHQRPMLSASTAASTFATVKRPSSSALPRVLVATPVRNAQRHLPRHLQLLEAIDYPRDQLSLAIVEDGSEDATVAQLDAFGDRYAERFSGLTIAHGTPLFADIGTRWSPAQQYRRRAAIARARNQALALALGDAQWVLWIDADVIDYPPSILNRLLDAGADVVTPHCVLDRGGESFDLNTFVRDRSARHDDWTRHACDGLVQPPRGIGRRYLDSYRGRERLSVDSVGATMLLVRADIHREGILFADFSYKGFIETEAFAMQAIERGWSAVGLPDDEIVHFRG